jgi:hypothetical protein
VAGVAGVASGAGGAGGGGERLEELAAELDGVAEGLLDAAMEALRDGLAERTDAAVERAKRTEKLINRARSSVEKAARLARQAAGAKEDELELDDGP